MLIASIASMPSKLSADKLISINTISICTCSANVIASLLEAAVHIMIISGAIAYKDILKSDPKKVIYGNELEFSVPNAYSKIKEWCAIHYQINRTDMAKMINSDEPNFQILLQELALK